MAFAERGTGSSAADSRRGHFFQPLARPDNVRKHQPRIDLRVGKDQASRFVG
jgi:hypothetical protein